ncbi:hypothetical protein FDA28_17215, partial [Clostridium botulinum]|nr:hypothetical protein [Clostridium botulinum]
FLEVGHNITIAEKLHHLLIVGESGSGKSTILEKVVAPLLNYPLDEIFLLIHFLNSYIHLLANLKLLI